MILREDFGDGPQSGAAGQPPGEGTGKPARVIPGQPRRSRELVETCATYWHTVDLLWVFIFSLLYVVR